MAVTTSKKVKYVGTKDFIDAETGEIQHMAVTGIEDRDFNFTKVWVANIVQTLDLIGNQKIKVCTYIIEHVTRDNLFAATQRDIAKKSGVSLQTVNITMKALLDADFIRKKSNALYIINPDMMFKGTRNGRMNILQQYQNADYIPLSNEEKLNNLLASVNQLQEQIKILKQKIKDEKKEGEENDDTRSEVDSRVQADAAS